MADDHSQRAYRSNEYAPIKAGQGNDPLAELARLIGQTDPFAEFGLKKTPGQEQRSAHPQHQDWAPQPYAAQEHDPGADYPAQHADPGQADYDQYSVGYSNDPRYQDDPYRDSEQAYDDVPPPHRRLSMIAIAAVAMLAVAGSAGAFGYRMLFGSSGTSPPPVIKAETTPTKIVPPSKSDPQSNKLIYDRVGDRSKSEKIVSREEQPLDISKAPQAAFPTAIGPSIPASSTAGSAAVASVDQPKKIHTIAIRPDPPVGATEPVAAAPVRAAAPPPAPLPRAPAPAPQRLASAPPVTTADAEDNVPVARATPQRPAAPVRNAPLSLSPNAPSPAAAPVRTASTPAARDPAPASATGQYAVQISSQRSEAEAQAAFRALQGKYPTQLGGRQPIIRRADLGSKGIYYRALVGPFAKGSDAVELCQSLKAAGGSCLIQKN
jgi:hypothetical protein